MNETTIQLTSNDSSENYQIFESADGSTIVGMYVANEVAERLGEFAQVTLSEDGNEDATAEKQKDTSNYGVFELPPAITGMYVSHGVLDSDETEDGPVAPDEVTLQLEPSDEETFENSLPDVEDQADSLVSGADESDESDEPSTEEQAEALVGDASESEDSDSEPVEISDEELGLED